MGGEDDVDACAAPKVHHYLARLEIGRDELVFLTGHSGAGKSTLMRLIMLMERPSRGQLLVDGQNLAKIASRAVPAHRRKIDRISIFRARPKLKMRPDHTFSDEEYNTYSCPWHHNITAAVASFRTAKALKLNPGSTYDIAAFTWHNSVPFEWHSRQLLDLGLMEPGQWF